MNFTEQFKQEKGYDAYAYDENNQGQPRVIGYCENYVEWLENKLKKLLIQRVVRQSEQFSCPLPETKGCDRHKINDEEGCWEFCNTCKREWAR